MMCRQHNDVQAGLMTIGSEGYLIIGCGGKSLEELPVEHDGFEGEVGICVLLQPAHLRFDLVQNGRSALRFLLGLCVVRPLQHCLLVLALRPLQPVHLLLLKYYQKKAAVIKYYQTLTYYHRAQILSTNAAVIKYNQKLSYYHKTRVL